MGRSIAGGDPLAVASDRPAPRAGRSGAGSAGGGSIRSGSIVRTVIVIAGGIVLMWLAIAVTLAMSAARPGPILALWPGAADADRAAAWDLIVRSPTPAAGRAALGLAGAALLREPVSAAAASTLGSAFDLLGQQARAATAFGYAERLSRRDLQTQLWLIEQSVGRGDVDGALRHYSIALRTKPTAHATLLPVLARASGEASVRGPLLALLRRRPSWRLDYLRVMLQAPIAPIAIADQIAHAGLDPADADDAAVLSAGLARLVAAGQYRLAVTALPAGGAGVGTGALLRNGGFERTPALLPFDWWLAGDADLSAWREPGTAGAGAYVLRIASADRSGPVARQLVALPAGRFALDGIVANTGTDAAAVPSVTVSCAGIGDAAPLLAAPLAAAPGGPPRRFSLSLTIPGRNCPAQWIAIATPPTTTTWLDALRLRPWATDQTPY